MAKDTWILKENFLDPSLWCCLVFLFLFFSGSLIPTNHGHLNIPICIPSHTILWDCYTLLGLCLLHQGFGRCPQGENLSNTIALHWLSSGDCWQLSYSFLVFIPIDCHGVSLIPTSLYGYRWRLFWCHIHWGYAEDQERLNNCNIERFLFWFLFLVNTQYQYQKYQSTPIQIPSKKGKLHKQTPNIWHPKANYLMKGKVLTFF